jgi:hypothetical protein
LASARQAYQLAKVNAEHNTGDRVWADEFAVMTSLLATQLRASQRLPEALSTARQATDIVDGLLKEEPHRHRYSYLAADNRLFLAETLIDLNRLADASAVLGDAVRRLDEAIREVPGDFYVNDDKVTALTDQVIVNRRLGNLQSAYSQCREALDLAARLIRKDPAVRDSLGAISKLRREAAALGLADPTTASGAPQ